MINILVWTIIGISIAMAIFQFALASGAEWGNLAWGGNYKKLPVKLRMGSLISALVFILAIFIVLEKSNVYTTFNSAIFIDICIWVFVLIFGLSLFGNLTSKSKIEKKIMAPTAFIVFFSFLILGIFG